METITFHCKVITPMFLAGADGQTPELRAPSIKGAMRFWWRALNGHLPLGDVKNNEGKVRRKGLKTLEEEIFGGTKHRSSVNVIVKLVNEDEDSQLFNYERQKNNLPIGVKYFQYTFLAHTAAKERNGFSPGTQFHVEISSRNPKNFIQAVKVFWFISRFGGLGTRVRRGGGAFSIESYNLKRSTSLEGELKFLEINPIQNKIELGVSETSGNDIEWSHICKAGKGFICREGFSYWYEAMHDIAYRMMKVRDGKTRKQEKNLQQYPFSQADLNKKAAFGLPIQVRKETQDLVNLTIGEEDRSDDPDKGRRASPIYISITEIDRKYHWTVVFLKGKFNPNNSRIEFKRRSWDSPDMVLFEEFISSLEEASNDDFYFDEKPSVIKIQIS